LKLHGSCAIQAKGDSIVDRFGEVVRGSIVVAAVEEIVTVDKPLEVHVNVSDPVCVATVVVSATEVDVLETRVMVTGIIVELVSATVLGFAVYVRVAEMAISESVVDVAATLVTAGVIPVAEASVELSVVNVLVSVTELHVVAPHFTF
jgi:hypothetical protein